MAMKQCKECGNQVSTKANKCPNCGLDQRNWFMKHKIISVILVLIILAVIGNLVNGGDSTETATKSEGSSSPKQEEQVSLKVGDVINTDKFEITITSVEEKDIVGNEFLQKSPSEGGTYVAVQWKYKNISDKPVGMFDFPSLNLIDKNETEYNSDIEASTYFSTEVELDAKIISDLNPGITVNSANVFEVSKDSYQQGGWKLSVNADKDAKVSVN